MLWCPAGEPLAMIKNEVATHWGRCAPALEAHGLEHRNLSRNPCQLLQFWLRRCSGVYHLTDFSDPGPCRRKSVPPRLPLSEG